MRTLLTTLAILVILLLTAALFAPMLVEWTRHRSVVEARLSAFLGEPVRIDGSVKLRLLPTPRLELTQVSIGAGSADAPAPVEVAAVRVEMATTALLHGELQLSELSLDKPVVRLARDADATIGWPLHGAGGPKVRIDRLVVRGGTVEIADARSGAATTIAGLAIDAEVSALSGPFRGSGRLRTSVGPMRFRFSAGALAEGRMPVKVVVDEAPGLPRAELDGALAIGAAPVFRGRGDFGGSGPASLPWRLSGKLELGIDHARLDDFDVHVGDDRRFTTAKGSLALDFAAAPKATATLVAKNVDVDRQFGGNGPDAAVPPRKALAALRQLLDDAALLTLPRLPLTVDFRVGLLSLGGDVVSDATGTVAFTPGQPLTGRMTATGPGDSRAALDGTFDVGVAPRFQGRIELAAGRWRRFVAWVAQDDPRLVGAIGTYAPFAAVRVAAAAQISGVGFALQDLVGAADRSAFAGTLAFTAAVGGERARLSAYLTSEALDVDHLPDIGLLAAQKSDLDLALDITARTARVAGVGDTRVDAGRIELKLDRVGGVTALDHLRIAGLTGASVEAHGRLDHGGGSFEGHLDAPDVRGIASLVQHVVDERIGGALLARALALSPAKLDVRLRSDAAGAPLTVSISANAGGTRIEGAFDSNGANHAALTATAKLDAADGGRLLRQLGVRGAAAMPDHGPARITLSAHGPPQGSLEASATADLAGTRASWHGRFEPVGGAFEGSASLTSADLVPILRSLGVLGAAAPALAAQATGQLDVRPRRATLQHVDGVFAGARIDGNLALTPGSDLWGPQGGATPGERPRVTGTVRVDKLSLTSLTSLVFGPPSSAVSPGGGWSAQRFAPVPAVLPETRLAMRVASLDVGRGIARNASLDLTMKPGQLSLKLGPSAFRGGTLSGAATFRRGAGGASLDGRLRFAGLDLLTAFAHGKVGGSLDFAGSGDSPRALVIGLAGQGSVSLSDGELSRVDVGSVDRVIAAVDSETVPLEPPAISRLLERETGRSDLPVRMLELPVLIAAGKVRLGPATLQTNVADVELGAQLDLAASAIDSSEALTWHKAPEQWPGPPPRLTLAWSGPWAAPVRRVEASAFFNGLSARALAINLQKLEAFDADVRERAFFNRRLKVIREHEAEERRAAEAKAAQERRQIEDERRRREEEKQHREKAQRAEEAHRLQEILHKFDAAPATPPMMVPSEPAAPPATAGPRPGG